GFDTREVDSPEYARTEKISDTNGEWVRLKTTKTESGRSVNTQSLIIGWFDSLEKGDFLEIRNIKLERGNRATPWSAAPEDLENELLTHVKKTESEFKRLDNEVSQRLLLTKYEKDHKETVQKLTAVDSSLTQLNSSITQKVDVTKFNNLDDTVKNMNSTLTTATGNISTLVKDFEVTKNSYTTYQYFITSNLNKDGSHI